MKLNNEAREILDRYLLAVKRQLSGKDREDITAEIESHIFEVMESKFEKKEELTTKELEEVLKDLGSAYKVAGTFGPQRSLIGPRLYPIFILILKILVGVVTGALLLSTIITTILGDSGSFWSILGDFLGTVWSGALSTTGMVTIIFAIIERVSEEKSLEEIEGFEELKEMEEFKVSNLPELPKDERKFDKAGTIIEIFFGVVGLAFFTYIQTTGGFVPTFKNPGTEKELVRLFTDSYLVLLPMVLAISGLEVAQAITLLIQGHISALTSWWKILAEVANIVLMGFLIKAMPIITLEWLTQFFNNDTFSNLAKLANTGLKIAMIVGIIGTTIDVIRRIVLEIKDPTY